MKSGWVQFSALVKFALVALQILKKMLLRAVVCLSCNLFMSQVMMPKTPEDFKQPMVFQLPPGDYIIGDVQKFLETTDVTGAEPGQHDLGGLPCITGTPFSVSGYHVASNGRKYAIRHTLGIMDARLAEIPLSPLDDALEVSLSVSDSLSSLHRFASEVSVEIWKGVFKFSSQEMQLVIDTRSEI